MASGGYREPNNPAPVSGPGAMSQRTDGGPTQSAKYMSGLPYGQGQAQMQQQTSAPMAGNPTAAAQVSADSAAQAPQMPQTVGMFEPTQRPDEPITSGIDQGAGVGSDALMMRQPDDNNFRATIMEYMPVLAYVASLPNASPETRAAIRQLRDYA